MATQSQEDKKNFLNQIVGFLPACISLEVKRYIACQFALESNFGSAGSALCYNNYCGMKVATTRITLARNLSEKGQFACFSGIYSNILDYLLWLQYNRFTRMELSNLELFQHHLDIAGYCNDLGYYPSIDSIYKQYFYE